MEIKWKIAKKYEIWIFNYIEWIKLCGLITICIFLSLGNGNFNHSGPQLLPLAKLHTPAVLVTAAAGQNGIVGKSCRKEEENYNTVRYIILIMFT